VARTEKSGIFAALNKLNGMVLFLVIAGLLAAVMFSAGLFVFIRSLIRKQHAGCGLTGFLIALSAGIVIYFWNDIFSHQPESDYKHHFEMHLKQSFPQSGAIINKKHAASIGFFPDYEDAAVIKMDSSDYDRLLSAIRCDSTFERFAMETGIDSTPQGQRIKN
jgi:hypothetical protein